MNMVGPYLRSLAFGEAQKTNRGFTIVELLIVIVVIAILAAITIVAYGGIQNRANDSAVSSDLAMIAKKAALYQAENDQYPLPSDLSALGLKVSKGSYNTTDNALVYCVSGDRSQYAIIGRSKSNTAWYAANSSGNSVKTFSYAFPLGGATVCPQANTALTSPNWIWLHTTSGWVSYV